MQQTGCEDVDEHIIAADLGACWRLRLDRAFQIGQCFGDSL